MNSAQIINENFCKLENVLKSLNVSDRRLVFETEDCIFISFNFNNNVVNIKLVEDEEEEISNCYSVTMQKELKTVYMFYIRSERSLEFCLRALNNMK